MNPVKLRLKLARAEVQRLDAEISDLQLQRDVTQARVEAFTLCEKHVSTLQEQIKKRKRVDWGVVFKALFELERYRHGFGYDEIMGLGASLGETLEKSSLRGKMMTLVKAGHAERISDGRFRITQKCALHFGLINEKTGPVEPVKPATCGKGG